MGRGGDSQRPTRIMPATILLYAVTWAMFAVPVPGQGLAVELETVASDLNRPVAIVHAGDGADRLFIVQQTGEIMVFDGGVVLGTPFLDLSDVLSCCNERGLLGLAFHPEYTDNGFFYVNYTDPGGNTEVSRYQVSAGNPDVADSESSRVLLQIEQPFGNHNGGNLAFGPDGHLYIGTGDGGSGGDPGNRAQDKSDILGKILRIAPEGTPPAEPNDLCDPDAVYGIPPDNPFVGGAGDCDEIWAYGLRNPWRFSFDRETGDLWVGDVGQNAIEEIDLQPASSSGGENYGWRLMEGSTCFNPPTDCNDGSLSLPVLEYSHGSDPCSGSVTGGYRYRGDLYPQLRGVYFYGDFCKGTLRGTLPRCDGVWESLILLNTGFFISTFGEDEMGEIYVAEHSSSNGKIHRLKLAAGSGGPTLAASPGELEFGEVGLGGFSAQEIMLQNTGSGQEAVQVESMVLSDETNFVLDVIGGSSPCGTATPCLAPGENCSVDLIFEPVQSRPYLEALIINGNHPVETVWLVGTATTGCTPEPSFLELSDLTVSNEQTFEACDWISAGPGVQVTTTGSLSLTAGTRVILNNGFAVASGGSLVAAVDAQAGLD